MSRNHWIIAQIGAREHYAVPRAVHRKNLLSHLYTDAWCRRGQSLLQYLPDPIRSFSNRNHYEIPNNLVTDYTATAILQRVKRMLYSSKEDRVRYQHHISVGRAFAERVCEDLRQLGVDQSRSVFYGYDTGCREVLKYLEGTEWFTIVNQIDPGPVEKRIVLDEIERWPGWATDIPVVHQPYVQRRREEWEWSSIIVVNSEWSKKALTEENVPEEKIRVVPLAYEPSDSREQGDNYGSLNGDLQILWLGQVGLRKGIQYLVEAAHELRGAKVQFDVVGPLRITEEAVSSSPPNMTFHGRVPRDKVGDYYKKADVFVLPTLSDGFAITQLEAMSHGLPVITTPNCGRVVQDAQEGFVVPPRDSDALVSAISQLGSDRERLRYMSEQARVTARQYSVDRVADELTTIVRTEAG